MKDLALKPLNWLFAGLGLLIAAMTAFVVLRPVTVVPRLAAGPEYYLEDQHGQLASQETLAGRVVLFGFGYTYDQTDAINQTIEDMQRFQWAAGDQGYAEEIALALILFDDRRDTVDRRQAFAVQHGLDQNGWLLLGGDALTLKRVIGQGFGVYYEAVPLNDLTAGGVEALATASSETVMDDYGYLQAQRYILVDERNIIRAEYRAPLDLDVAMRDLRLIVREKNSTGISRTLNETAHLFLCYPR